MPRPPPLRCRRPRCAKQKPDAELPRQPSRRKAAELGLCNVADRAGRHRKPRLERWNEQGHTKSDQDDRRDKTKSRRVDTRAETNRGDKDADGGERQGETAAQSRWSPPMLCYGGRQYDRKQRQHARRQYRQQARE